jgi:hypothetical protein
MGSTATEIARAASAANASMVKSQYEAVTNLPLVAAFVAFAVAQSLKVLTTWYSFDLFSRLPCASHPLVATH